MRIHYIVVSLLLSGSPILPELLTAQTSDSATFHAKQWGAEFRIANGFFGAGALHFANPTHALLVDISTAYTHASIAGTAASTTNTIGTTLDLGMRTYHRFARQLYRLTTFGLSFDYSRQTASPGIRAETIGGGPFFDLGATWLATSHLGIGATWRAQVFYRHSAASNTATRETLDQLQVALGGLFLSGQLYF